MACGAPDEEYLAHAHVNDQPIPEGVTRWELKILHNLSDLYSQFFRCADAWYLAQEDLDLAWDQGDARLFRALLLECLSDALNLNNKNFSHITEEHVRTHRAFWTIAVVLLYNVISSYISHTDDAADERKKTIRTLLINMYNGTEASNITDIADITLTRTTGAEFALYDSLSQRTKAYVEKETPIKKKPSQCYITVIFFLTQFFFVFFLHIEINMIFFYSQKDLFFVLHF